MPQRFYLESLGCPKNHVDAEKVVGTLLAEGMVAAADAADADLVIVNTCAFVEEARQESVDTILQLGAARRPGSRLVVTGCLAERYGAELGEALPEVDAVAGFGVPVTFGRKRAGEPTDAPPVPLLDLLNLPRPPASAPWAYVKVAEGCDRSCGFCAIPSFRGPQRSRTLASVLDEVEALGAQEIVLVAQDLAAYGRDRTWVPDARPLQAGSGSEVRPGSGGIVPLLREVAARVPRVRLLYLYPSDLTGELVDAIVATEVPYFDLSLQHVAKPLLRRMRRWGDGDRFLARIDAIRRLAPEAAFRSNFIVGYPGETEAHHDELLAFVEAAQLDWCGFFAFSEEEGTYAASLDGAVPKALAADRLAELRELQDGITAARRDALIGTELEVLVDVPGEARSHREAPEIDGVVQVPEDLVPGTFHRVSVVDALGPDVVAVPLASVVRQPAAGRIR